MLNEFYFQISVTKEQKNYAIGLVDYSIKNHPVTDIFANDPEGPQRQRIFRYTGTLGEVVFADTYGLDRPTRSFGAIDGQDHGQDFHISVDLHVFSVDLKSMHRKSNIFGKDYVLNIPKYQLDKEDSITDKYFCISFHNDARGTTFASFLGHIDKKHITDGVVGQLFEKGTVRTRHDGSTFTFMRDTYEILFQDIRTPWITERITQMDGFKILKLK